MAILERYSNQLIFDLESYRPLQHTDLKNFYSLKLRKKIYLEYDFHIIFKQNGMSKYE